MEPLTPLEQQVWDAFPAGEPVVAEPGGETRGEFLTRLLLGARPAEPGQRAALRLTGARITGLFSVAFAEIGCPILLEECAFAARPVFNWARLGYTSLARSRLPGGVHGANAVIDGHLNLSGCVADGELRLPGVRITGGLVLDRAVLESPGVALNAERAVLGGDLVGQDAVITGLVVLAQARIAGNVNLHRVRCTAPDSPGPAAGGGEPTRVVAGQPEGSFAEERGVLGGDGLVVEGGFFARLAAFDGEVRMRHCRIEGACTFSGTAVTNPGLVALRLDRATLNGGLFLAEGFRADGEVRAVNAHVGRTLGLVGGTIVNPGGTALRAESLTLDGTLNARRTRIEGRVSLDDSVLQGPVHFEGATLTNPGSQALRLNGVTTASVVNICDGFTAVGQVQVSGARIGSVLCFDTARLTAAADPAATRPNAAFALRLWRSQAPEMRLRFTAVDGPVDLRHARVALLRDDPAAWPAELHLTGLVYDTLDPPPAEADRRGWLTRDPARAPRQPYEQLAAVLRAGGDDDAARSVLLTRERARTRAAAWPARIWGLLQDATVGYGYRPLLAALWLLALLGVGTVAYSGEPPRAANPSAAPEFHAVVYTLDVLLPLVDFGQQGAYLPGGGRLWLSYLLIAGGWILATTIAAALTRSLRRA